MLDLASRDAALYAAWLEHKSYRAAARAMSVHHTTVADAVRRHEVRQRGAQVIDSMAVTQVTDQFDADGTLKGFSVRQGPEQGPQIVEAGETLPGFVFKRISTNFAADGQVRQQWQIQSPELARSWADIERVIDQRVARIPPLRPASEVRQAAADILNQVTIADGHVGALAWGVETGGANWDLKIAFDTITRGGMWLIDNLPEADTFLLQVLGDFIDSDGYVAQTPTSKHPLDVDGRFPKISDVGAEVIEVLVRHALKRHRLVKLVILPGNHDPLTAMWMRKMFVRVFEKEPRVEVDRSIRNVWCMRFGRTMIAASHGDKIGLNDLPSVLANDFAPDWGRTVHRYCHTGHLHHKHFRLNIGRQAKGVMVYQHPTITARNAWAAEKGFPEARELLGHSYHRTSGMRSTLHFTPDMLARRARRAA